MAIRSDDQRRGVGGFSSGSRCESINNNGVAVGFGGGAGFRYDQNYGVVDLLTTLPVGSGWTYHSPRDINDWNQIVGVGHHNFQTHGFIMTPDPPIPTISQFGGIALACLLLTFGALLASRRRAAEQIRV